MKRTIAVFAAAAIPVALAGCGSSDTASPTTVTVTATAEQSSDSATTEAQEEPANEADAAPADTAEESTDGEGGGDAATGPLGFGASAKGQRWEVTVAKPVETSGTSTGRMLCPNAKSFVMVAITWKNIQTGVSVSPMEDAESPTFSGKGAGLCSAGEADSGNDSMTDVLPGRQIVVRQVVGLPAGEKTADVAVTLAGTSWAN